MFGRRKNYLNRKKVLERNRHALARSPFKTTKPRPGSLRALREDSDTLDARYVKLRDGFECQQGKAEAERGDRPADMPCEGPLDCGHLYPKSAFPSARHEDMNIHAQCRRHNKLHIRQPTFYFTWFVEKFGQEALDRLHATAVSGRRYTTEDLRQHNERRRAQIAQLEADRAVAA